MSRGKLAALLCAATMLAGCTGLVTVNDPVHHPNYVAGDVDYAVRNGSIRVEVAGETFGLAPEAFANRVVNLMQESYYRHELFTREASRATDPRYKIVMMFNPAPAVSGAALCAAQQPYQPAPRAPGETTTLLATFCGGTMAVSETQGWAYGGVSGPDDPKFAELVGKVTNSLFPKVDWRMVPF